MNRCRSLCRSPLKEVAVPKRQWKINETMGVARLLIKELYLKEENHAMQTVAVAKLAASPEHDFRAAET